jgi:hypothetical protein
VAWKPPIFVLDDPGDHCLLPINLQNPAEDVRVRVEVLAPGTPADKYFGLVAASHAGRLERDGNPKQLEEVGAGARDRQVC